MSERDVRLWPNASRYWNHPSQCDHVYVLEYLTASATIGYCRACGAALAAAIQRTGDA